jgi:hypothetical protein
VFSVPFHLCVNRDVTIFVIGSDFVDLSESESDISRRKNQMTYEYKPESEIRRVIHAGAADGEGWRVWRVDATGELWFRRKSRGIADDDDEEDDDDDV